tara:strand:- start:76829 stop:77215 length:387 start_codon:yes stop_codon:yes gene_type:complete
MKYSHTVKTSLSFDEAIGAVKKSLADNGFGVLTTIDVQKTMKEKIGADYDRYTILGACNPTFAHKALSAEKEIGLLLPCNVIVYEQNKNTYVSSILPSAAMSMVESDILKGVAQDVEKQLKQSIDALA